MRRWLVALACSSPLAACSAQHVAPTQHPLATATPDPAPPADRNDRIAIPMLAHAGDIYMLVVAGRAAVCRRWTVDPDVRTMRSEHDEPGEHVTEKIVYAVAGSELEITEYARGDSSGGFQTTCGTTFTVRETASALLVDDARWFRTSADCEQAIAEHARVATDLVCDVDFSPSVPEAVERKSRRRFERLLRHGGTLFSIVYGPRGERCKPVRVRPHKPDHGHLSGSFVYAVVDGDGMRGTGMLDYGFQPGDSKITLLGPSATWEDGSSYAFG